MKSLNSVTPFYISTITLEYVATQSSSSQCFYFLQTFISLDNDSGTFLDPFISFGEIVIEFSCLKFFIEIFIEFSWILFVNKCLVQMNHLQICTEISCIHNF